MSLDGCIAQRFRSILRRVGRGYPSSSHRAHGALIPGGMERSLWKLKGPMKAWPTSRIGVILPSQLDTTAGDKGVGTRSGGECSASCEREGEPWLFQLHGARR